MFKNNEIHLRPPFGTDSIENMNPAPFTLLSLAENLTNNSLPDPWNSVVVRSCKIIAKNRH